MSLRTPLVLLLIVAAALVPAASAAAHRDKGPEVVASGLANPRGLDVTPWGTVYVTEAGSGGTGTCIPGPEGDELCIGATGGVTKAGHGEQRRVVDGLSSVAPPGGEGAIGASDISLSRHGAFLTVGLGADPAARATLGELGAGLGQLFKITSHGKLRSVADIAGYEAEADPDGAGPDSNPNSVLAYWGRVFVADAGGNTLLRVRRSGDIKTVSVFPDRLVDAPAGIPDLPPQLPMQAVPTSIATGPDGALYVGQLTGFPFPPGAARVYRIGKDGVPEVYADGFTNITDIAFDRRGNLYVVEIASNGLLSGDPAGALIKVDRDGEHKPLLEEGLLNPTGVAVGRHGDIYVVNNGTSATEGEVLRLKGRRW